LPHFVLGAAESGTGGYGPGERIGGVSIGQVHLGEAGEGRADGVAEGCQDGRPGLLEDGEQSDFGAATGRGKVRERDGVGTLGKLGGTGPALGDGEQDGALVVLQQGVVGGAGGLVDGGAKAGGKAAEGIG